jgi:hypothetical protein
MAVGDPIEIWFILVLKRRPESGEKRGETEKPYE